MSHSNSERFDGFRKKEKDGFESDTKKSMPRTLLESTMFKRIVLLIAIFVCLVLGVYFSYFHRPPTADILAANMGRQLQSDDDPEPGCTEKDGGCDQDSSDQLKQSTMLWNSWIRRNNFVSIGKLFNKCNGTDKIMVGRVIMLPDEVNGGVTSRTYLNVTLPSTVTGGEMYLVCNYNGHELYRNHWELCTVEDGMDDRVINCPVHAGRRKFVKTLKIPNYLPKGLYETTAWLTNQDGELIGCALAAFRL